MNTVSLTADVVPVAEGVHDAPLRRDYLPFRVRIASDPQDVSRAVEIRASAYSRHLPHVGEALRTAEAEDFRSDVLLLIAERKLDRRAIGTLRLEPNFTGPMRVESETTLPPQLQGRRLVETSRLGVENGNDGILVTASLVKAAFEVCRVCAVDYTISVGRRSMAEVFRSMCFDAIAGPVHMSYAPRTPFWIFTAAVVGWEARLRAESPRYSSFMVETEHPDIDVDHNAAIAAFGRG